jgi:hypothetical protein
MLGKSKAKGTPTTSPKKTDARALVSTLAKEADDERE